jgi:CRISPR-associated protein Cas2
MFTIISYDVVQDKRRTKVAKCLLGYGTRVQYSVFECHLTATQFAKIQSELRDLIDVTTDSVRCYRLDDQAMQRTRLVGIGKLTAERSYYLIGGEPAP